MSVPQHVLETVVDQFDEGVYVLGTDGQIAYWSRGAERLLGYPAEEMVGMPCSCAFLLPCEKSPSPVPPDLLAAAVFEDGSPHAWRGLAVHRTGRRIPVLVRMVPLKDGSGRVVGVAGILTDPVGAATVVQRIHDLERCATLDHLTQMPNRRFLEARLTASLAEVERRGTHFGILLMDIDHFKSVNDAYGHQAGDEALRMVARALQAAVRACDTVGRWGGEEFMLIATDVGRSGLLSAGERFRRLVEECRGSYGVVPLRATMSVGGALARPGDTLEALVYRADRALYRAKDTGRNRVLLDSDLSEAVPAVEVRTTEVRTADIGAAEV